eukprot:m.40562 g.40562  ORF g.40562 m.40562 type:complete len:385 (+) comp9679_c0_seq1:168-1322(+)
MSTPSSSVSEATESAETEDFSDIQSLKILTVGGTDLQGRPIFCFAGANLPSDPQVDWDKLLRYMKHCMDGLVDSDYTIVYLHHGITSKNKPKLSWLRQVYSSFDRRYKKNLKALLIVHPSRLIKTVTVFCRPFISSKFYKKISNLDELLQLEEFIKLEQLNIPDIVKKYDDETKNKNRNVTKPREVPPEMRIFGANLTIMSPSLINADTNVPLIMERTIKYIKDNGMQTEGIFRRSANSVNVAQMKKQFNAGQGEGIEFSDVHLVAVLLKSFFRELQEPIIPFQKYSLFVNIQGASAEEEAIELKKHVNSLPSRNRAILKCLFTFLGEVYEHEEDNKMSANNLAIVFGPNLMWAENALASLADVGKVNTVTKRMLEQRDVVFAS